MVEIILEDIKDTVADVADALIEKLGESKAEGLARVITAKVKGEY